MLNRKNQARNSLARKTPVHQILRGGLYLGGAQTIRTLARALYVVMLARFLGPELFGLYNYGLSWYLAFMSLTFMGLDLILGKKVNSQSEEESTKFIAASLRIQLYVSVAVATLSALIGFLAEDQSTSLILTIFSLALLGRSTAAWASFVFIAKEQSNRVFWMESTCRISEAAIGCLMLVNGAGLLEVVALHAIFWWIQALWALRELEFIQLLRMPGSIRNAAQNVGVLPIILGLAGVAQVWLAQGPLLLFRLLGGDLISLGQIALALQVFALLAGMSWAVCRAALPQLSKCESDSQLDHQWVVTLFPQVTITGVGFITALTYIYGSSVIELLVGREYSQAASYVPYVIGFSAAYTLAVGGHQILAAYGAYLDILVGTIVGAIVLSITMLLMWDSSPVDAPFYSLGTGLLTWLLIIGRSVYTRVWFSAGRVLLMPLTASIVGLLLVGLSMKANETTALIVTLVWFLPLAFYIKLSGKQIH